MASRLPLAGFLVLAGLLLPSVRPEAQTPPRLETETFPQSPLAGEYWAVRFLVDHPLPREVEVELPPLPPALSLDRIRVEPRLTEDPDGTIRRQTMLEYYFFLNAAGPVSLRPFELSVPLAEAPAVPNMPEDPERTGNSGNNGNREEEVRRIRFLSPAVRFLVRAPGEAAAARSSPARSPRLFWNEAPALLHPGEEAELALVHQGWDPRLPLPSPQSLMPRTPVGAILEASPPREDDQAEGVLLRLRLIPLEEGRLNIPAFKISAGDYNLDIPALSIPVSRDGNRERKAASPAPVSGAPGSSPEEPAPSPEPSPREKLPFPKTVPKPLLPFSAGCGNIRDRAAALWDRGLRVEALAELRRNERDYAGGPALIPLRRETEKLLGLSGNGDETWRPRFLLGGIFVISAGLALGVCRASRLKPRKIAGGAIFYPANSEAALAASMPDNRDFYATGSAKAYKRDRPLVFLFLSFLSFPKKVTPGPAWCYKVIGKLSRFRKSGVLEQPQLKKTAWVFRFFTVFFALLALFSLWGLGNFSLSGLSRPALTREAEALRVPGPEGTAAFRLEEGRRVLVRSLRGEWAYIESVHNVDTLWTDYLKNRIFAAFRRENARSVRKVTDFVDRHYIEIPGWEEGGKSGWVKTAALVFY